MAHLAGRVNSWRDQDVRRVLAPTVRWAEDADVAVVVVVHLNKADAQDVLTRVGGSIGIVAAARSLLVVAPDPQADQPGLMLLVNAKNNLAPQAPALRYRLESRTVTFEGKAIPTSGIAWLGEVDTPEDLLARPTAEERSERQEAVDCLREFLQDGPRPSRLVFFHAKQAGFAERTLWRARRTPGVKARIYRHPGGDRRRDDLGPDQGAGSEVDSRTRSAHDLGHLPNDLSALHGASP